ncbi:unnamed protein product [Eruca vesicaria subsp. sativa]|uniref:Uncharacterized protein n=1 Tax=Eruca vesicaria subsp. sativa TaxID=29727 RepID=A0ABC8J2X4_ERUVS|nr:unnamed protein product [Eruca vesicaria subsp. sativa]
MQRSKLVEKQKQVRCVIFLLHHKFFQVHMNDDEEYIEAIKETSIWSSAKCLRKLFCTILLSNSNITPENIWNATWKILSKDINNTSEDPCFTYSEDQTKSLAQMEIESMMRINGSSFIHNI